MKSIYFLFSALLLTSVALIISCKSGKKVSEAGNSDNKHQMGVASPPAIVYKTKKDYSKNVPVILSDDKSKVISFPAHSDLKKGDDFAYPTPLVNGYWLDNRGISRNTAFLKFTYQDYYTMDNIPDASRLMNYVIDNDPFTELYQCGRRGDYKNIVDDINKIIAEGKLAECKNLLK